MDEAVARAWRRHELRRQTEVPTVTLFVGDVGEAPQLLTALRENEGLAVFETRSESVAGLAIEWVRQVAGAGELRDFAFDVLARGVSVSVAELRAGWRARSDDERRVWLAHAIETQSLPRDRAALRWLELSLQPTTNTSKVSDPVYELSLLCEWLPRALWPVPCLSRPNAQGLDALARLALRLPTVPLIAVVAGKEWRGLIAEIVPRHAAVLTEGVINVFPPANAVESPDTAAEIQLGTLKWTGDPELAQAYAKARDACECAKRRRAASDGEKRELAARARSMAESLLFHLLQKEPLTKGLFELNARMPFTFGSRPAEVDLVCTPLGIAIEVDGYYHFTGNKSYRRDRRKDVELQTHGFLVTRYLASDVTEQTGEVLHSIVSLVLFRRKATQEGRVI